MTRTDLAVVLEAAHTPPKREPRSIDGLDSRSIAAGMDEFLAELKDGTHRIRCSVGHLVRSVHFWKGMVPEESHVLWTTYKFWISQICGDDAHPDDQIPGGYDLLGNYVIKELEL